MDADNLCAVGVCFTEHKIQVSSGISTTKERLEILSYDNEGSSNTVTVIDLVDKENKPLGTKTIIKIST